jgi:hypothetical protein
MVYKLTDDPDGVITPEESIASPPGETKKLPPAILKEGVKKTDPSTSTQLLGLVYESAGLSFAVIVMVTVDVLEHVAAVVYDTVYVPGVDVEGVIPPVLVFNVKPLRALKTPPESPVIVGEITETLFSQ